MVPERGLLKYLEAGSRNLIGQEGKVADEGKDSSMTPQLMEASLCFSFHIPFSKAVPGDKWLDSVLLDPICPASPMPGASPAIPGGPRW